MAQTKLTGATLLADINGCKPKHGELAFWWLGQHSFVIKLGGTILYLDPFLTELKSRQVPPLLKPAQVTNAHYILGSHDHLDHIDRPVWPALAQAAPEAFFVVPDLLRARLSRELKIPLQRFIGLDDGKTIRRGAITLSAVAAAHEFLDQDRASGRYPYLGYIVSGNGCTLYHAGDSCVYEGLQRKLKRWRFDLVCLPINGRDATRLASGCIGNMTYQEAADLAGALQPRLTVPTHYEMFAGNPGDPQAFADYMRVKYPRLRVQICQHGQRTLLKRRVAGDANRG